MMAVTFLLDTCILSETSKPRPHPAIVEFLQTAENFIIPVSAIMEFHFGIMQLCSTNPVKAVKLSAWYQDIMSNEIPVADTTREVAEIMGTLAWEPRLQNVLLASPHAKRMKLNQDLTIAATALVEKAAIATMNVKDFLLIDSCYPLPGIYNPLEDRWYARMEPLSQLPA